MNARSIRITHDELMAICKGEGADDAGFVELERPALEPQIEGLRRFFPSTATVVVLAVGLNRDSLRSTARHVSNYECGNTLSSLGTIGRTVLRRLSALGIRGVALPPDFPMEFSVPPKLPMVPSHKILAEEAGLGMMGLSRLILNPRLGSSIYMASLLLDSPLDRYSQPLTTNPCISCKMCVAACPVGAIRADGSFDPQACANHNYRELAPGFMHWVEALVCSPDMEAYCNRFTIAESLSWWQSLAIKPGYKCNHCLAVCPAGEETSPGFLADRKGFMRDVVRPLVELPETVYVQAGSLAEENARANPAKQVRLIGG